MSAADPRTGNADPVPSQSLRLTLAGLIVASGAYALMQTFLIPALGEALDPNSSAALLNTTPPPV